MNIESAVLSKIFDRFDAENKKENLQALFKGLYTFLACFFISLIILASLEGFFYFSKTTRGIIFFSFTTGSLALLYLSVIRTLLFYTGIFKNISYERSASRLGGKIPDIKDNLLNVIQIAQAPDIKYGYSAALISESLNTLYSKIENVDFDAIIDKKAIDTFY